MRLFPQIQQVMRLKHYSIKTEKAYLGWIRRYIKFHGLRHPASLNSEHVTQFLSSLAVEGNVSSGTQNQALNALVFLYKQVLKVDLKDINACRARDRRRIPVVLSEEEVSRVLSGLSGTYWLMTALLYGTGMRLSELLRLRVKDLDFDSFQIIVRDGKGEKDRVVPLPHKLRDGLKAHLQKVKLLHEKDTGAGFGSVYLPYALERKYPRANQE